MILISVILGLLTFLGAGSLSYTYLSRTLGGIAEQQIPAVVVAPQTHPIEQQKIAQPEALAVRATTTKKIVSKPVSNPKVIAPGPLRIAIPSSNLPSSTLSLEGVIKYTNVARAQNGGLPALSENQTLDVDARLKLEDMFASQYFEHVSPTGVGPAELAGKVGYAYIIVGENLALGDFNSDKDLVTAWMNSPGHRANILNTHYEEIGVAVGRGIYEGRNTWLAVQSFGMPRSSCPIIDTQLKTQIDVNNETIVELRAQLDSKKAQIDATPPSDPNYTVYVNQFNALVPQYNSLVEVNRTNVLTYNAEVRAYNDCINAANPHPTTP